jgi:lipopolysaccharide/colanic/teichoic acid biosynthesis glycosyltransferase
MIKLFRVFIPAGIFVLFLFEAIVVFSSFLASIYLLLERDPTDYLVDNLGYVSVGLVTISILAGVYFQDLYSEVRVKSRLQLLQQLMMVDGFAFLLEALLSTAFPDMYLPLGIMLLSSLMATIAMFGGRLVFGAYLLPRVPRERLLLIGNSPVLGDISSHLDQQTQLGIEVAGRIPDLEAAMRSTIEEPAPGGSRLEQLCASFKSKSIVVGMPDGLRTRLAGELLELRFLGFSVQEAGAVYAKIFNRESLIGIGPTQLLYSKEYEPGVRALFFQGMANWLIALVCLIVFLPVLLPIVVLVRIGGPVLDRQIRCGRNGIPFTMYSFRIAKSGSSRKPTFVDRLLTRTGLYCLPQLFNVLRGQMSIVGPRPHRPEFADEFSRDIPFYPHRCKIRPGMTGWTQLQTRRYPGLPDIMVELEYDLYYLKSMSPTMDLYIMVTAIKNIMLWGGLPDGR